MSFNWILYFPFKTQIWSDWPEGPELESCGVGCDPGFLPSARLLLAVQTGSQVTASPGAGFPPVVAVEETVSM